MADITIVNGLYKPTYNWGAPSCNPVPQIPQLVSLEDIKVIEGIFPPCRGRPARKVVGEVNKLYIAQ